MENKTLIKRIVFGIIGLFVIWFIFFRTIRLTITYDGVEETIHSSARAAGEYGAIRPMMASAKVANNYNDSLAFSNAVSTEALYDEAEDEIDYAVEERYRENRYYRVDTNKFDDLVENLKKVIKEKNGIIKINEQNSSRKKQFDREFYPRFQNFEFTISNETQNVWQIEEVLKKYGSIRIANTNQSSIEQELVNYEQQLKEMEEARKALQASKDRDWIARQDSDLAKKSERIKNQIENAKKQSEYKTYDISIYEMIYFDVNSIKYWYSNNYLLQDAIATSLPEMIKLFAKLIPITIMLLLFVFVFNIINMKFKQKDFVEKLKAIKESKNKDVHLDIKV